MTYLTIDLLLSFTILSFTPYEFSVPRASASPDTYSDSLQYVHFTVEGATFVHRENHSSTNIDLWFVIPPEGDIKITASCGARGGDGYITLSLVSPLALAKKLDEAQGRDVGLSVSGSLGINESAYYCTIEFGYGNEWGQYIGLQFMAQPVITWFKVNATMVPLHDEVKIYGEVKPKELASQVFLNFTHEGEFYNTYQAAYDSDYRNSGSFYYTFFATSYDIGEWTVIAEVWSDRGGTIPDDLITDTASVRFTVTNETQPSTPPLTESPTQPPQSPQPKPQEELDLLDVLLAILPPLLVGIIIFIGLYAIIVMVRKKPPSPHLLPRLGIALRHKLDSQEPR